MSTSASLPSRANGAHRHSETGPGSFHLPLLHLLKGSHFVFMKTCEPWIAGDMGQSPCAEQTGATDIGLRGGWDKGKRGAKGDAPVSELGNRGVWVPRWFVSYVETAFPEGRCSRWPSSPPTCTGSLHACLSLSALVPSPHPGHCLFQRPLSACD